MKSIGTNGYHWPALAAATVWGAAGLGAHYFAFNTTDINTSNGPDSRWVSFPLRRP